MKIGRAPARARSRARKLGYARCLMKGSQEMTEFEKIILEHILARISHATNVISYDLKHVLMSTKSLKSSV
jgi:hypothetical protein